MKMSIKVLEGKKLLIGWLGLGIFWLISYLSMSQLVSKANFDLTQLVFSRISLIMVLVVIAFLLYRQIPAVLNHISHQPWLGIFRIVFCGLTGIGTMVHPSFHNDHLHFFETTSTSLSDSSLLFLVDPFVMKIMLWVLGISGIISALGWQTRKALFIFFISSLYVFGATNLYGKINHHHHLFWFPLILIFSNSHRFYSIDEWMRRRKGIDLPWRPDYGIIALWLTISIMYFFPGFWKVWRTGIDWIFSDGILNQFYLKWRAEDWLPFFRIDHYPILLKAGVLFIVLFELSFITLILNRSTQLMAIVAGTIFHLATWLFLDIFFFHLIISYLVFLPPKGFEKTIITPFSFKKRTAIKLGLTLFLGGNILAGFTHYDGHFFTCYPTFSYSVPNAQPGLAMTRNHAPVPLSAIKKYYPNERFQYWEYEVVKMHERRDSNAIQQRLKGLLSPYRKEIGETDTLRIYSLLIPLNPDAPVVEPTSRDTAIYQDPS